MCTHLMKNWISLIGSNIKALIRWIWVQCTKSMIFTFKMDKGYMSGVIENYVHKKLISPREIRTENYAHQEWRDFIKREESVLESITKA